MKFQRKFRKGDVVSIKGTVKFQTDGNDANVYLDVDGYYTSISVPAANATLIYPFVAVGEIVHNRAKGIKGEVIAANDGALWVREPNGVLSTWRAMDVEIIEETEPEPVEPETPHERPEIAAPKLSEDETVF